MNKLEINPNNEKYYSEDFIRGYRCGTKYQFNADVKVLKQIRVEIDVARFIDKDTKLCKNANASGLEVAMQIIDKHLAERESEE